MSDHYWLAPDNVVHRIILDFVAIQIITATDVREIPKQHDHHNEIADLFDPSLFEDAYIRICE